LLNLGHTVGHALEAASGFTRYRHGEAVALGLVAEAAVAEALGSAPQGTAARVEALVERLGLRTRVPPAELLAAWPYVTSDKKRARGSVRLPLLSSVGASAVMPVSLHDLASALGINPPT
jgi:3-dehydroquinate synthetase